MNNWYKNIIFESSTVESLTELIKKLLDENLELDLNNLTLPRGLLQYYNNKVYVYVEDNKIKFGGFANV